MHLQCTNLQETIFSPTQSLRWRLKQAVVIWPLVLLTAPCLVRCKYCSLIFGHGVVGLQQSNGPCLLSALVRTVLRLRHSLSRAHETGTGALQEDSKNVLQLSSGTTSVWGAMRARAAASDGASSAVPSTNIGRTVFKANQPEPKNITAKLLWRQVLGPTQREFRVQETLELDYDFRVSSIAFISSSRVVGANSL